MDPVVVIILVWLLLTPVLLIAWAMTRKRLRRANESIADREAKIARLEQEEAILREKLSPVTLIEDEVARLKSEAESYRTKTEEVRSTYTEKRKYLDQLEQQVAVYDERLALAELGIYEPHFDYTDSDEYKRRIIDVRDRQKKMISAGDATHCPSNWTVDGSLTKGKTMINRQTRLTMRAFNNECEAAIANTRWNNVNAMERRILTAAKAIDTANTSMSLKISEGYVALKLNELYLTHEYREQLKAEKEERAEMVRAEREERKLLAEAEAAEKEERKYQLLLDRARSEAGADASKIAALEAALADAHATSERARSMAEMTKSGYVYIISNIGSFGDDVVKIGLTRRLDPDDRVRELGDASVPFTFDTHAMIYSDGAPALEAALHREFADRRINMSNMRKEFFRVSLDEVEDAVGRLAPTASFFKDREAQEWHETMARRKENLAALQQAPRAMFPAEI